MPESPAYPSSHSQLESSDPRWTGGGMSWTDYAAINIIANYLHDRNLTIDGEDLARLSKETYAVADALYEEKVRRAQL